MIKKLFLTGFSTDETLNIDAILSSRGVQVHEIQENPVEKLTEVNETCLVFVGVHDKQGLKLIKRLTTDAANHLYACGVAIQDRKLLFSAKILDSYPLFFLPPDEMEIKKVYSSLQKRVRNTRAEEIVFQGLKNLKQGFEWETASISISETCRYLAKVMHQAGFYTDSTEEAQAVLALEEALVNSVEHGNLELGSSLKPAGLLEQDRYEELKNKRLKEEKYGKRKIRISFELDSSNAQVSIQDEGPGFDTSKFGYQSNQREEISTDKIIEISGMGFNLMKRSFSSIQFNDKGTEITLIRGRK